MDGGDDEKREIFNCLSKVNIEQVRFVTVTIPCPMNPKPTFSSHFHSHHNSPFIHQSFNRCRYALGHLLAAIEQFEEERVRGQCQNLLRVARRLLGKIGKYQERRMKCTHKREDI